MPQNSRRLSRGMDAPNNTPKRVGARIATRCTHTHTRSSHAHIHTSCNTHLCDSQLLVHLVRVCGVTRLGVCCCCLRTTARRGWAGLLCSSPAVKQPLRVVCEQQGKTAEFVMPRRRITHAQAACAHAHTTPRGGTAARGCQVTACAPRPPCHNHDMQRIQRNHSTLQTRHFYV